MKRTTLEFLYGLRAAESAETAFDLMGQFAQNTGAGRIQFGYMSPVDPSTVGIHTNFAPDWDERYVENAYAGHDPVVLHCLSRSTPMDYDARELYRRPQVTDVGRQSLADAMDMGLRTGFALPVRASKGALISCMLVETFGATSSGVAPGHDGEDLLIAAYAAAWRILGLVRDEKQTMLLPLERETLLNLAAGHRTQRISHKLNYSDSAVEKAQAKAIRKLGAPNRAAAVARATAFGLIEPQD